MKLVILDALYILTEFAWYQSTISYSCPRNDRYKRSI